MACKRSFVFLFILIFLVGCSEKAEYKEIIRTVIAYQPSIEQGESSRTLAGVLQPADLSILSFELAGVVKEVNVNLGESFEKGDVLATIDTKLFELAVQQRKAQVSETLSRLKEAQLDFERKQKLVSTGAVSQAVVDVAESRFKSLVDQVEIAKTQLEIAQEDLSDTKLIAPYAGSVTQRQIEPSQQISPSSAIFTIQGSDALEVSVLVPETMIASISKGDAVNVNIVVKQQRQSLTGYVFEKGKQAQRANAFPVTISLPTEDVPATAQPGMSAEVSFLSNTTNLKENSLRAPLSAVAAAANNTHYVYEILNDNNTHKLKRVPVNVITMQKDQVVFTANQPLGSIVRVGLDFLSDGQIVHIQGQSPQTINQ